ncbi:CDGP domain-containing protein [Mycolicibacter minnesotensis]
MLNARQLSRVAITLLRMGRVRLVLVGVATVAVAVISTGVAVADPGIPGDPATRCQSDAFGTTQWCDEPIQADGTWRRCWHTAGFSFSNQYGGVGGFVPATGRCVTIDEGSIPFGQPGHIDG